MSFPPETMDSIFSKAYWQQGVLNGLKELFDLGNGECKCDRKSFYRAFRKR